MSRETIDRIKAAASAEQALRYRTGKTIKIDGEETEVGFLLRVVDAETGEPITSEDPEIQRLIAQATLADFDSE